MKIDLNFNIKALDGKELENQNAGKLLANLLVNQPKGDTVKYYDWALKLYGGQPLDLDRSDHETLRKFVDEHQQMFILAKAQILEALDKKKE